MSELKIRSDISGSVWKILVQPGATVAEDEPIAILESMKMEIPVLAPEAGTIRTIEVEEGVAIAEGAVIAVLDT